jgi:hypothetical protein
MGELRWQRGPVPEGVVVLARFFVHHESFKYDIVYRYNDNIFSVTTRLQTGWKLMERDRWIPLAELLATIADPEVSDG